MAKKEGRVFVEGRPIDDGEPVFLVTSEHRLLGYYPYEHFNLDEVVDDITEWYETEDSDNWPPGFDVEGLAIWFDGFVVAIIETNMEAQGAAEVIWIDETFPWDG